VTFWVFLNVVRDLDPKLTKADAVLSHTEKANQIHAVVPIKKNPVFGLIFGKVNKGI
jgi:hypothetical protein